MKFKVNANSLSPERYLYSSIASNLSRARNIRDMHQIPASATIVYIMRLTTDEGPPQIHATISN